MEQHHEESQEEILKTIATGRTRTNILRVSEQKLIAYLVPRVPQWMTSDVLTGIGFFGNLFVGLTFVLAKYVHPYLLLLSLLGFAINWFGDSLDGRIAYYRNKPRRWYGFSLDVTVDWIGVILIGLGYIIYAEGGWKIMGFLFVVFYGWEVITMLLRYKITKKHAIDSGFIGPTELRIILALLFVLEVIIKDSINYLAIAAIFFLLVSNFIEIRNLLRSADSRDERRKRKQAKKAAKEKQKQEKIVNKKKKS